MPGTRTEKHAKQIVATRTLARAGLEEAVTLTIEVPAQRRRDWACTFTIAGAGKRVRKTAYGLDALQALLHAVELARQTSQVISPPLEWHGIPYCGLPRLMPLHLDENTARRIEALIDKSTEAAVSQGQAARKRREK